MTADQRGSPSAPAIQAPTKVTSPCKPHRCNRSESPDAGYTPDLSITPVVSSSPDWVPFMHVSGAVLDLLEKHLDPMVHEAEMAHSMYSPDTTIPRPVSPVFILSAAGQGSQATTRGKGEQTADVFFAELSTPVLQPLLPVPGHKQHRPCRNKVTISAHRHSARLATKAR